MYDTKEEVVKKFGVVLVKFFDQLAFVSSKLVKNGYSAPHPKLITLSKKYMTEDKDPGEMLMKFALEFHQSWDHIFARDFDWVSSRFSDFLGADLPSYCIEMAKGIIEAKKKNGESAIEPKDRDFILKLLEGFCILSLKYVFWEMEPVLATSDGSGVTYTFNKELEGFENLNINSEIRLRAVPGLPQVIDLSTQQVKINY